MPSITSTVQQFQRVDTIFSTNEILKIKEFPPFVLQNGKTYTRQLCFGVVVFLYQEFIYR